MLGVSLSLQSQSTVIKPYISPNYLSTSYSLIMLCNVTIRAVDSVQTVSPAWPEEVYVVHQRKCFGLQGEKQPEIETGCKWSWTDILRWNLEKETAHDGSRWEVSGSVC